MTQGSPGPPKPHMGPMGPQKTFGGDGKIWERIFQKTIFLEKKYFFSFFSKTSENHSKCGFRCPYYSRVLSKSLTDILKVLVIDCVTI